MQSDGLSWSLGACRCGPILNVSGQTVRLNEGRQQKRWLVADNGLNEEYA